MSNAENETEKMVRCAKEIAIIMNRANDVRVVAISGWLHIESVRIYEPATKKTPGRYLSFGGESCRIPVGYDGKPRSVGAASACGGGSTWFRQMHERAAAASMAVA